MFKRVSLKGLAVGVAIVVAAPFVFDLIWGVYLAIRFYDPHLGDGLASLAMLSYTAVNPVFLYSSIAFSAISFAIGGYLAAKVAGRDELLNASLVACIFLVPFSYAMLSNTSRSFWWQDLLILLLNVGFAMLGGYWRLKRSAARTASVPVSRSQAADGDEESSSLSSEASR